ncbi:SprT-like protein [Gracilibacillus ureilyticus]|uniref:Protein SprT-like n=1 Tax=Gracilibacillus ureilyticus TaxID=531814 RepID=A0A1H9NRW6_9BACI|nr:SprT family protein [Gracilibacillus ureilyticus]SER38415.1 SprT-like protein [Gracilibacillus ureilyticus]
MVLPNQEELTLLVDSISKEFFYKPFKDQVVFNNRLRTTGGRYLPSKRKIELNPKYVTELGDEEFIGIIKHELCHYHLHIEGKGFRHRDKEFRELLKKTGSPRFCNPLPSMKSEYKYLYKCVECSHIYHRKRRINLNKYRCGRCRGKLAQDN